MHAFNFLYLFLFPFHVKSIFKNKRERKNQIFVFPFYISLMGKVKRQNRKEIRKSEIENIKGII